MGDLRPWIGAALDAFGLPATVTRPVPDTTPIVTKGFWLSPVIDAQPTGTDFKRRDPRRVFVVPRADVPQAPRGSTVCAAEVAGGPVQVWQVDGLDQVVDPDHLRLIVVLAPR